MWQLLEMDTLAVMAFWFQLHAKYLLTIQTVWRMSLKLYGEMETSNFAKQYLYLMILKLIMGVILSLLLVQMGRCPPTRNQSLGRRAGHKGKAR